MKPGRANRTRLEVAPSANGLAAEILAPDYITHLCPHNVLLGLAYALTRDPLAPFRLKHIFSCAPFRACR